MYINTLCDLNYTNINECVYRHRCEKCAFRCIHEYIYYFLNKMYSILFRCKGNIFHFYIKLAKKLPYQEALKLASAEGS